ncbi:hypothetical protein HOH11_00090 [Candidatus Woesearchaeota archaeon]|nr:hypothetical protein [Candidatus Woesearchaeota archaeon]
MIPKSLRQWFLLHFIVDILFAAALIFYPQQLLDLIGLQGNVLSLRIIGAALIAIGGTSLLMHKGGKKEYGVMLNLKLLWSISAVLVLLFSTPLLWPIIGIFLIFISAWVYYKKSYNL